MNIGIIRKCYAVFLLIIIAFWGSLLLGGYDHSLAHLDGSTLSADMMEVALTQPGDTLTQVLPVTQKLLKHITVHVANGHRFAMRFVIEAKDVVLLEGSIDDTVPADRKVQLFEASIDASALDTITLRLVALEGNDATLFYGNMVQLSRGMVAISDLDNESSVRLNDQTLAGKLNVDIEQITPYNVSSYALALLAFSIALLCLSYFYTVYCFQKGKSTSFIRIFNALRRYRFVLQQLVSRNFKAKYKRSVLGILWSFLNPLLTMLIQYVVFSTLFKSNLPYFPVYLLSGTICFSFFSEATCTGLSSISGNASLITKVYIPKYIFPISAVLSSSINFLLTLIPLLGTLLISGLPITRAFLILPILFFCLLMLSLGVTMLLSTAMVFFRDTQFLWNVIITLLNFATPLFYPESIIPERFSLVLKLNPIYHVIRSFRVVLINGIVPDPKALGICLLYCTAVLAFGTWVFKRKQDKFVLNL